MNIRIGTRGSKLALWQAHHVAALIEATGATTQITPITTKGDKILDVSINKIGSKGVFTEEIEQALANDEIDIAVHSAKDMPSELPEGFSLIAFSEREKVNDVVVSHIKDFDWNQSTQPVTIGTSSTRRIATLKHFYPHIKTVDIRGNLQTRIRKMEEGLCDAILLAYAGVHRMNYDHMIAHELPLNEFVPAVGQGSIAIEVYKNLSEEKKKSITKAINHEETAIALKAERSFLKTLQGGCSIPAFAHAYLDDQDLHITGGIISLDGQKMVNFKMVDKSEKALTLGEKLGETVLESGGRAILEEIKNHK
jgi:hydroxymethylbilane synthase